MTRTNLAFAFTLLLALPCLCLPATTFYVSPSGRDSFSGTLPSPNPAHTDGPFATIVAARDAVRALKASAPLTAPVDVLIRAGTYRLSDPLVFTPADSGTEAAPITYAAYPGEHPLISGGRTITGWQKSGKLWIATIPDVAARGWAFRSLFVSRADGTTPPQEADTSNPMYPTPLRCRERRVLARDPNEGYYYMYGTAPPGKDPVTGKPVDRGKSAFRFSTGDIKPWPDITDADIFTFYVWETGLFPIKSVDPETDTVVVSGESKWPFTTATARQRYFIEGAFEALDAPGEFYLDRRTGKLFYYPVPGEDPSNVVVTAPVVQQLVLLQGDPDAGHYVDYLSFRGLRFSYADYALEPTGHGDWQAAVTVSASIHASGSRHCSLDSCEVSHIGNYAVWFERGCQYNRVAMCHLHDLGAGGVRFGQEGPPASEPARTHHNVCTNNFIHDAGYLFCGAVGVWIGHASDNEVTHNEICDINYTGISCGWSWGYGPTDHTNNLIAYNHIHHVAARGVMSDTGAIYTLGLSTGTRLDHNLIHDCWNYPPQPGAGGIYPDEGSSGITIENNVVYDTISGGFTMHYGEGNLVRNNIFAFGRDQQVVRGRDEEHLAFTFERNLIYYDSGATWVAAGLHHNYTADHNLYFNASGQPLVFLGNLDFKQWQALGQDVHSVIADPRFVDPAHRDFRLRPDSPALALGFVPIDMSTVGLTGPRGWTDLPRQIKRAHVDLGKAPVPTPNLVDEGFERTPLGSTADGAVTYGQTSEATIRVTDEQAASGKRSLKFTDAAGLDQPWNPHMWYTPNLYDGVARLQFDLRLGPGAQVWEEWRDNASPYHTGPSLGIDADGNLKIIGAPMTKLPAEKWIHFDITCTLGEKAPGKYSVTVTIPGQKPVTMRDIPCDPKFRHLEWMGFISNSTDVRVFYLDNVKLTRQ